MIVPGKGFAPFKSCPGDLSRGGGVAMVLDEIDTCITYTHKSSICRI